MALTPEVRVTQAAIRSVTAGDADLRVNQSAVRVVFNIPTEFLRLTQATLRPVIAKSAPTVRVAQSMIRVVAAGRVADPTVRAWTFTLDGHDFYVLRLGDTETLVFDLLTDQWVNWDSHTLPFWRVNSGITWAGGQSLGVQYGSNIVIGDDTIGLLWALNPERAYDEATSEDAAQQQIPFIRMTTGQVTVRGREVLPCYAIFLIGDNFGAVGADFTAAVTLEYSDDAGKTYDSAGTITVTPETAGQEYEWLSLGQIEAPGRLFRITDNGVFARIDLMTMNDPDDA